MKIFIPSYNRGGSIRTPLLLTGADYKVILHNEQQKADYIKHHPELGPYIVVSGLPKGISGQRNWIIDNLMKDGEWACMMDDNIRHFNKFPDDIYWNEELPYEASKRYAWEHNYVDVNELKKCFAETVEKAESIGAVYCGFASINNAFFRKSKWKYASLIVAKMSLIKKTEMRYDDNVKCIDDYAMSCDCLAKQGKILVNAYVRPVSNHCEAGGIGRLEERAPMKQEDVKYLMAKYPGLLRIKDRINSLPGCEVSLRFYSENSINRWRKENGFIQ